MTALRVAMLGRCTIEVNGKTTHLPPKAVAVLIRLVLANGVAVTVADLARDVWLGGHGPVDSYLRGNVQKQVSLLRVRLDPERPGEASTVLVTERGENYAYRLRLADDQVDLYRFRRLLDDVAS